MKKSTILALLMVVSSGFLFSGCVVPADGYYSDPYYRPSVVVAPALPYTVNLYDRPYYTYGGFYYYYNNSRWYYRKHKNNKWIVLPRKHWPRETRWKGHHYYHDHRGKIQKTPKWKDPKYRHDKDSYKYDRYRKKNDPRWDDRHRTKQDSWKKKDYRRKPDPRYKDKHRTSSDPRWMKKDPRRDSRYTDHNRKERERLDRKKRLEEQRRSDLRKRNKQREEKKRIDLRKRNERQKEERRRDIHKRNDRDRLTRERNKRDQRKMHPPQEKKRYDQKRRGEAEERKDGEQTFDRRHR